MQKHAKLLVLTASVLALLGCSREGNIARSFYSEAGSEIGTRDFGASTLNNTLLQSGELDYAISLTKRFASEVPSTVNFAFNSSVLDDGARAALVQQANWIRQFPEVRFRVYGHTDLVGSKSYNQALGLRRANAVVAFLTTQGISRSRLEAVVSFGKTQPLVYVQGPERQNRRTVTEVSGFVQSKPLVINGKYAAIIMREYVQSAVPPHLQAEIGNETSAAGG